MWSIVQAPSKHPHTVVIHDYNSSISHLDSDNHMLNLLVYWVYMNFNRSPSPLPCIGTSTFHLCKIPAPVIFFSVAGNFGRIC